MYDILLLCLNKSFSLCVVIIQPVVFAQHQSGLLQLEQTVHS